MSRFNPLGLNLDLSSIDPESTTPEIASPEQKYTLIRELGEGAFGKAFLGEDAQGNKVVIKNILKQPTPDRSFNNMILREHYIPLALQKHGLDEKCHPQVACLIDFVETPDSYQIVSEYIPGVDMYDWDSKLEFGQLLELFLELAEAYTYLHSEGVVHRDIKPSNIIISTNNHPYVIDFGISCITNLTDNIQNVQNIDSILCDNSSIIAGTPDYMAPELLGTDSNIDLYATDVYSLGVLFYLSLNREYPVKITDLKFLASQKMQQPKPSHHGTEMDPLIDSMLSINPADRPTMSEVRDAIENIIYYEDSDVSDSSSVFNTQDMVFSENNLRTSESLSSGSSDQQTIVPPPPYSELDKMTNIFNEDLRSRDVPNYQNIPKYDLSTILEAESEHYDDFLQKFYDFQPTSYEDNYLNYQTSEGEISRKIKIWSNDELSLEFWTDGQDYLTIFSSDDYFLTMGHHHGKSFIITPEFAYSFPMNVAYKNLESYNLDAVKGLAFIWDPEDFQELYYKGQRYCC